MSSLTTYAAFADELQKIAEEKKDSKLRKVVRGGVGVLMPILAGGSAGAAFEGLENKNKGPILRSTRARVQEVAKAMGVSDVGYINSSSVPGPAAGYTDTFRRAKAGFADLGDKADKFMFPFNRKEFSVNIPYRSSEAVIAHELGHVRTMKRLGLPYIALGGLSRMSAKPGTLLSSAYAAGQEKPTYTAGALQAGLAAPMLVDEVAASAQAVNHMRKRYGWKKGLAKSTQLLPAFGTYAAIGLTPLAITALRKRLKNRSSRRDVKSEKLGMKIAKSKLKKKLSGETTLDADNFSRQLEDSTKTTPRGPHPALNYEHGS